LNQEKLLEEITDLKEQLTNQKELRNFNWKEFFIDRKYLQVLKREKVEYFQQLKEVHEKHDQLKDKLTKVKELVKNKHFTELTNLDQRGQI
jgi:hypothetical protein